MLTNDPIVKVSLLVSSAASATTSYDVGLILGTSDAITETDRVKTYASSQDMLADGFSADDDEYIAASAYFNNTPAPQKVLVGLIKEGETPVQALTAVLAKTNSFYGVYVCGATKQQILDLDTFLTSYDRLMQFYGVADTATAAIATDGLFATLNTRKSKRSIGIYHHDTIIAPSLMGLCMGMSCTYTKVAFALCYKSLTAVETSPLTQTEVDAIKALNGNVYVTRGYNRTMIENGATASGMRFDEVLYLDRIAADTQDACLSLIKDRSAKLPQADMTSTLFISAISSVLDSYVDLGVITSGTWRGGSVGSLTTGDTLDKGYMLYADSYAMQSVADRELKKAMPITCCLVLAGSVESVQLTVYVQR